jgi:nucleoside-diphosphate-sugar epimerase
MRVLITGVAGFIGSSIARRMLAEGHEVVGIDSFSSYYDRSIKESNIHQLRTAQFSLVDADINSCDVDSLLADVEVVFHQAGQPGVRKSWGDEFAIYASANILATQRLLEAARRSKSLLKFVYASSSSLYGNAEGYPTSEAALPKPISPYGVSKLAAEHLCSLYASNFNVPTVSLRYFTVYGPGQRPDMAFTRFVKSAVLNEEIRIFGSGEQIRDFTFIDDIVNANVLAATSQTTPGDVFNVAGGTNISVNEVLAIIEEIHGSRLNVRYIEAVAGDVIRTGGDISKIQGSLGWTPVVGIEEGLRRHYEWAQATFASAELSR